MKRLISIVLCFALLAALPLVGGAAEEKFAFNSHVGTPLYLISGEHVAGQEFVAGFSKLAGVRVYLENTVANNRITVSIYEGSAANNGTLVYQEDLSLKTTGTDWVTLTFSQPVTITPDAVYSFTLNTESRAVWSGTAIDNTAVCKSLNYDQAAYGGWVREAYATGFEVLPIVMDHQDAYTDTVISLTGTDCVAQIFASANNQLSKIGFYLNNKTAGSQVSIQLYGSLQQAPLFSNQYTLDKTGADWYEFTLQPGIAIEPSVPYIITVTAETAIDVYGVLNGANGGYCAMTGTRTNLQETPHVLAFYAKSVQPYEEVEALIAALPSPVTLQQEEQVAQARVAYNGLNQENQKLVGNYTVLTAAEDTIQALKKQEEEAAVKIVADGIAALFPITRDSAAALQEASQKVKDLVYDRGLDITQKIENYKELSTAYDTYNDLIDYENGNPNQDETIDAMDALLVLKYAVGKEPLTQKQVYAADVNNDKTINASDALLILKYSVQKIDEFPADAVEYLPIQEEIPLYSKKNAALFQATYQSMLDRTKENGYAQTSITGAYAGMFGRDSSIQIMAHVAAGDYEQAKKILQYTLQYHKKYGYDYLLHIMANDASPISDKMQIDSTFFFLHAWYLFAVAAPDTAENQQFLADSEEQIKTFANYYLTDEYLKENKLFLNPSLEHSRDVRYWYAFDLLTNTYASQALHEMSLYFAQKDPESAKRWGEIADDVAQGIHKNLTAEIDGKRFYAELIDVENDNKFYEGFSWVNLAPMGCDWYAADPELLENTYQLYMTYGSCYYYGKYQMLDVCSTYNGKPLKRGDHVIGKGLAWEMMYCKKMGYYERLATLVSFIENNSDEMYRETWGYGGGGSDTANQEHASWMLFAHQTCFDLRHQEQ